MDETETGVHPENEISFDTKKKWAVKPWEDMGETQMHNTKWKKSVWIGYIMNDSNSMAFFLQN